MKLVITIVADTNDGDYVTSEKEIDREDITFFMKVAKIVTDKGIPDGHNWVTSEYSSEPYPQLMYKDLLTEDDIDWFGEHVPYGEHGVHSIESIEIREINTLFSA